MKDGRIVQQGTPQQIYKQPINEYCAGLFGEYSILSKELAFQFQIDTQKRSIYIRPTGFSLHPTTHSIKAIVYAVFYYGTHYLIHVKVGMELLKIQTNEIKHQIGEIILISIDMEQIFYL